MDKEEVMERWIGHTSYNGCESYYYSRLKKDKHKNKRTSLHTDLFINELIVGLLLID